MLDVARWLAEQGLGHHAEAFAENGIAGDVLHDLTDADLKELGLNLGDRKRLLKGIAALDAGPARDEEEPAERTPPASPRDAERRQLTVMFVDLVGSTALSAGLDPEETREVIRAYQDACAEVIARFEGHIAKYMGDGVLAYFGWPRAHEDEAERAVRAGFELVGAVARLETAGGMLAARVGIATGLVVVGDLIGEGASQEEAVVGDTPNLAARLQSLAEPGQVVIAQATGRLVGAAFELRSLGPQTVKGLMGPVGAFAVSCERFPSSRFEARSGASLLPMVGRDQELALLLDRWALAKAGEGQGVLLVGEAGIGKSRISRALLDAVADEPHVRMRYQCSPYHTDSALWPVIQQLTHAAGITTADPADAKLDKLDALLARASGEAGDVVPLVADLIGLDYEARYGGQNLAPQARRARTLEALVRQLLGLAARQPVLVMLEDAHWIDPTTLELIEQCLDRIAAVRALILLTSRPDQQPALAAHPDVTRLTLNRLGRGGVKAIVARLGGEGLPGETVDAIVGRTDGIPLFVEELTKAILEAGETKIPASLHDSLMARLDRIPDVKETAQIAACIGREFPYELLAAVADKPAPQLCAGLDQLAAAEIVFHRGSPPDARYTFKHGLLRDAAYESLLKSRRRQLHARIVRAMEESPDSVAPEVMAFHAQRAGLWRQAVDGYTRAARLAADRWAMLEATSGFQQALQALESVTADQRTSEEEIDLRLELNNVMWRGSQLDGMAENLALAERNARRIGDQRRLASALTAASRHFMAAGQPQEALRVSNEILKVGEAIRDPLLTAMANCRIGLSHHFLDQNREAIRPLRKCLSLLDGQLRFERFGQPGALSIVAGSHLVYAYAWLGEFDAASAEGQSVLETAESIGHPYEISFAAAAFGFALRYRGDYDKAVAISRLGIEACERSDVTTWVPRLYANLAVALARSGEVTAGAAVATRVTPATPIDEAFFACAMAEVFLQSADEAAAMAWSEKAFALSRKTKQQALQVQAKRLRVAASLRNGAMSLGAAQVALSEAIETSEKLQLRAEAIRGRLDLARLWARQGERKRARDLLALIDHWLAEGFDSPDLKDAKVLLDQLA